MGEPSRLQGLLVITDFMYPDSFRFSIAVEDSEGYTDSIEVTVYTNDSIEVLTQILPDATVGVEYYTQIEYQGGTQPLKWNDAHWDIMNLGLTLDELTGEVHGIPDTVGSFELRVSVFDASGCRWGWYDPGCHVLELTITPQEGCGDVDNNSEINLLDIRDAVDSIFHFIKFVILIAYFMLVVASKKRHQL